MPVDRSHRYVIDPKFKPAPPTPAKFFFCVEDPGTPPGRQAIIRETCERWRGEGVHQVRATLTGPEIEGDDSGYPAGLWLEGWLDPLATMLPFGGSYPEGGPCYPPLTDVSGHLK